MGYFRKIEDKKRLKRLYSKTKNQCSCGVYFNSHKKRYIKYSISDCSCAPSFYKKASNRRVRYSNNVGNHNAYKREYEYNWKIY